MSEHKYAKELRAFAEGAVIERQRSDGLWQEDTSPFFGAAYELRIAPIQPPDADGWRRWYGGKNPAPGKMVDYKLREPEKPGDKLSVPADFLIWQQQNRKADITHWRESAQPKAEAEAEAPKAKSDAEDTRDRIVICIQKYDDIAAGKREPTYGTRSCALCEKFFGYDNCIGCPVVAITGKNHCKNSPYENYLASKGTSYLAKAEANFLRTVLADFDAKQVPKLPDLPLQKPGFGPWIRWEGGENPVGDARVSILCGTTQQRFLEGVMASALRWGRFNDRDDIIAYCVKLKRVKRWRWDYIDKYARKQDAVTVHRTPLLTKLEAGKWTDKSGHTLGPRIDWTAEDCDE